MSKIILVRIVHNRNPRPGEHQYGWPAVWNAQEVDGLREGSLVYNGGISRGEDFEEAVASFPDALASRYIDQSRGAIREISRAEATAWIQANPEVQSEPEEIVTNERVILGITAKLQAALLEAQVPGGVAAALTRGQVKALDPDDTHPGIVKNDRTTIQRITSRVRFGNP